MSESVTASKEFAEALLPIIGVTDMQYVTSLKIEATAQDVVRVEVVFFMPASVTQKLEAA